MINILKPVKMIVGNTSELWSGRPAAAAHCVFTTEALRVQEYKTTL